MFTLFFSFDCVRYILSTFCLYNLRGPISQTHGDKIIILGIISIFFNDHKTAILLTKIF